MLHVHQLIINVTRVWMGNTLMEDVNLALQTVKHVSMGVLVMNATQIMLLTPGIPVIVP